MSYAEVNERNVTLAVSLTTTKQMEEKKEEDRWWRKEKPHGRKQEAMDTSCRGDSDYLRRLFFFLWEYWIIGVTSPRTWWILQLLRLLKVWLDKVLPWNKNTHLNKTEQDILSKKIKIFPKIVLCYINLVFLDTFFYISVTYFKGVTCRLISAS